MLTISDLVPGQVYTNLDITEAFKCSPQGGMRRAKATNSLVIFALHHKSLYSDEWNNDIMHYTGMGQVGDQSINFGQNKTLAESNTNGITVYLFEGYEDKAFIYDGIVKLVDAPYEAMELDSNSDLRKVIKFPIKLVNGKMVVPSSKMLSTSHNNKAKIVRGIPDDKLKKAAEKAGNINPKQSKSTATAYERDELVAGETKRRANGVCDLCGCQAPFNNKDNEPYLECHHVKRLADNGPDMIYNTVALCPNCHKKIHILNLKSDNKKLVNKIGEYLNAYGNQQLIDEYKALFELK